VAVPLSLCGPSAWELCVVLKSWNKQKQMGERGAEPLEEGRPTGGNVFAL